MSSYYLKSVTPNAFEAALRHKEGELASYMSRLVCSAHDFTSISTKCKTPLKRFVITFKVHCNIEAFVLSVCSVCMCVQFMIFIYATYKLESNIKK